MDYFRVSNHDLEKCFLDMNDLRTTFYHSGSTYHKEFIPDEKLGLFSLKAKRKGSVHFTNVRSCFSRNILLASEGIDNLGLFYVKNGGNCFQFLNNKADKVMKFPSNSHNVFFLHEDFKLQNLYKSNAWQEAISVHIPIPYFEQLARQYPELFEDSYIRYKKGESFYLKDTFQTTASRIYGILTQIENSDLMGNASNAYVDAKVLELLSLQFQSPLIYDADKHKPIINKDVDKIREAALILLSDIDNPPSIRELAIKVGINEKKLKYGFKAVYNTTVYGYLFDYKMQLAEQLLLDTSKTVKEIAFECGYQYTSHFCTAFKRKFGVTPQQRRIER